MRLFHGSNTIIESVDLHKCTPYKDFGRGFYLTAIKEQASLMAKRTAFIYGEKAIVTVFEFDEVAAYDDLELSIKFFDEPDEEWALFVMNNRSREQKYPPHEYDIVIGPVADDVIATLFRNFEDGIIDIATLVNRLQYKKVSSQYFFHSQRAVRYLRVL